MPAPISAPTWHLTPPAGATSSPPPRRSMHRPSASSKPRFPRSAQLAEQPSAPGSGLPSRVTCRVVGTEAWFQVNFVRLGIHPGFALSMTLPRLVGSGRASDLLLTARRVDAHEAQRIGLAERVVEPGTVIDESLALASEIAAGSPTAVAATRATLRDGLAERARAAMAHELDEQAALAGTPDAREGVLAMLEGRVPRFTER